MDSKIFKVIVLTVITFAFNAGLISEVRFTCRTHGGINCDLGKDNDGSVICFDGFKDSAQRFNFECTAARLSIEETQIRDGNIKVFIRNSSSVSAIGVAVSVMINRKKLEFNGPKGIDGYGGAEYVLTVPTSGLLNPDIGLTCINCQN